MRSWVACVQQAQLLVCDFQDFSKQIVVVEECGAGNDSKQSNAAAESGAQ